MQLPTFRRWGTAILRYKVLIAISIVLWLSRGAVSGHLAKYYAIPLSAECHSDCPEGAGCDPLVFKFEIAPKKISLSKHERLWYRASIKNRTCEELAIVPMRGFVNDSEVQWGNDLWIQIAGHDGGVIRRDSVQADGGIAWDHGSEAGLAVSTAGVIHPYRTDLEEVRRRLAGASLNEEYFGKLSPGEEFSTVGMILRPYRVVATSVYTDGGLGHGYRYVDVKNPPEYAPPPNGFNELSRFRIDRPGKYRIRAGYKARPRAYPIYERWHNRPWIVSAIFRDAAPDMPDGRDIQIDLKATEIEIEVVP